MEDEKPRLTRKSIGLQILLGVIVVLSTIVRMVLYVRVGVRRVLHWVGIIPELGTLQEEMTFGFMKPLMEGDMVVVIKDDDGLEDLAA